MSAQSHHRHRRSSHADQGHPAKEHVERRPFVQPRSQEPIHIVVQRCRSRPKYTALHQDPPPGLGPRCAVNELQRRLVRAPGCEPRGRLPQVCSGVRTTSWASGLSCQLDGFCTRSCPRCSCIHDVRARDLKGNLGDWLHSALREKMRRALLARRRVLSLYALFSSPSSSPLCCTTFPVVVLSALARVMATVMNGDVALASSWPLRWHVQHGIPCLL